MNSGCTAQFWPIVDLGSVTSRIRNGLSVIQFSDLQGIPITRIETISDETINPQKVGYAGIQSGQKDEWFLEEGDILFSHINSEAHLGKCALYTGHPKPFIHGMNLLSLKAERSLITPEFLLYLLRSPVFKSQIPSITKRAVNQASLSIGNLKTLKVPLPPLSEQRLIVEILDQAAALRKKRAEADAKAERILPALFIRMFGDPVDWAATTKTRPLGSLVEVQSGGTPSKKNPDYWEGDIPWVSPKDMKQDSLFDAIDHISHLAVEQTNLKYVEPGTILIVVRGMILAHTVPIALAGCQLTINQDMKALQPKSGNIDSMYLYAALKASSRVLLSQVRTAAHGTRKLDTDELLQIPILVPSQQKQEEFRQRMTAYSPVVANIKKTGEILDRLFETFLYRGFSGDLTAKWRDAHIKELLAEMEEQAKCLATSATNDQRKIVDFQGVIFE